MNDLVNQIEKMLSEGNPVPRQMATSVIRATLIHVRDNVLFELASRNAVDEALKELGDERS